MTNAVDLFVAGVVGLCAMQILLEMLFRAQRMPRFARFTRRPRR